MSLEQAVYYPLIFALLFVLLRFYVNGWERLGHIPFVGDIPTAEDKLIKRLDPKLEFNFQSNWVANLTLISAFLAIVVKLLDSTAAGDWTALSFFCGFLIALAALTNAAGNGYVWPFLLAAIISIWGVVSASAALYFAIGQISVFPALIRNLTQVGVLLSSVPTAIFAWQKIGALLDTTIDPKTKGAAPERAPVRWSLL